MRGGDEEEMRGVGGQGRRDEGSGRAREER